MTKGADCKTAGSTSPGSAGHAPAGATANSKLTFHLDHSVGADDPNDKIIEYAAKALEWRKQDWASAALTYINTVAVGFPSRRHTLPATRARTSRTERTPPRAPRYALFALALIPLIPVLLMLIGRV